MVIGTQPRRRETWQPTGRTEKTQDYYVSREMRDLPDYWVPQVDPDGNVRDRVWNEEAERARHIEAVQAELAFIERYAMASVLDFGAGLGWFLSAIDPDLFRSAVETSPIALRMLRRIRGLSVFTALDEVPTASQDVVVAHHVFEHLVDPIAAINHIRRILAPGGYLVLGTPDFGSPCAKRFGPKYRMLHDPTHISLFTLESMHRFLRDHAFTILDVQFPFPARYATAENFDRWNRPSEVSPPWPGNWMTFYCQR